jgi:hypothetical protein
MSHELRKESDGQGVLITFSGIVEVDEINKLHNQIKADKLFPEMLYQVWDFSEAEELNISFDNIRNFAINDRVAAKKNATQRIAIIPRNNKSRYQGLDKMYHILETVWGAYETETFFDVDTAREWGKSGKK